MIRIIACFFGLNQAASSIGAAADPSRGDPGQLRSDALGEFLRGQSHSPVTPEVLLRIL